MTIKVAAKVVPGYDVTAGTPGPVADADKIETSASSDVQTELNTLSSSLLTWKMNSSVTDGSDPGGGFLALNNAAKALATNLTFNTTSNLSSARFDEYLTRIDRNDALFIWEQGSPAKSVLYRARGVPTSTASIVTVPVAQQRTQGGEFTDQSVLNILFLSKSAGSAFNIVREIPVDATDATTFATSLSGVNIRIGDAFSVTTSGQPFAAHEFEARVGDVIASVSDTASLTSINDWVVFRTADYLLKRDDVDPNYRLVIESQGQTPTTDLTSLESKVDALFPLTVDVPILTALADIYVPEQATQTVTITDGYTRLADFRSTGDRFESAGVVYAAGTDVSNYSGLTDDLHRCFGVTVPGPSNTTILSIMDGATAIPFLDMTAGGNFRVNDFVPARAQDQQVTGHLAQATLLSGTGTIAVAGAVSTYTVPAYPANTNNQTRSASVGFDVLVSGSDSLAGGDIALEIPNTVTAQAQRNVDHTFNLGFPSNRRVDVTIGYEFRVVGPDLVLDLKLVAAPSDITLSVNNVSTFQSYTATSIIPRVDRFTTLRDAQGVFSFTGENEILIAFHPQANNRVEVVPVVIETSTGTITELNDALISVPSPGFDEVRVPDTLPFRTFLPDHFLRHTDLSHLLADRATKWVYALARLQEVSQHAFSESVDLAAGSTIGGVAIGNQTQVVVYQATGIGTGSGELASQVVLPANYTDFDKVYIGLVVSSVSPVEWRGREIKIFEMTNGDFGASHVFRIQGNSDVSWTVGSRTFVNQGGSEIYRVVLEKFF
jgi:hypothetical protein